ncbi:MAG: hypothetical protein J0H15_13730 [Xanthomonadales bacterium]|nr:hypothetical protein [Xanthomonadales bacterium]
MRRAAASIMPALRRLASAPLARGLPLILALLLGAAWLPGGAAMADACAGDSPVQVDGATLAHSSAHGDCADGAPATPADMPPDGGNCCDGPDCACMACGVVGLTAVPHLELPPGLRPPHMAVAVAAFPTNALPRPLRPPIA